MSREAIRKAIKNLNILFAQFEQKKYLSKQKLLDFENLVIYNLKNFILKLKELNETRYRTKIKNCSGFMKVDQILKVWSLLSPKILISSK